MSEFSKALAARAETYRGTLRNIIEKAQNENRSLTESEQRDFDNIESKINSAQETVTRASRLTLPAETIIGNPRENKSDEEFRSFGRFLQAICDAGMPGGTVHPRLHELRSTSGMGEAIGSDGGFAIETSFVAEIQRRAYGLSELAQRCRKIPVSLNSNSVEIPFVDETSRATGSRLGGVRVYRQNEGDQTTPSKPKLGKHELRLLKLVGLAYVTEELLQDSALLGALIMDGFAEEMAFVLDDEIFRGSGAGQCLGILNAPALVTVSKEGAQSADTFNYENAKKMWARCWGRSRRNSIWLINQEMEPQLYSMSQTVGSQGFPVFMPAGGASEAPYSTLFRRPIIAIEQASALGDVGDIALVDLSQYMLIEKPMQAATSMHVRFDYGEQAFRFQWRNNGQPSWKTALTPYKGASALSPFVVLEAR